MWVFSLARLIRLRSPLIRPPAFLNTWKAGCCCKVETAAGKPTSQLPSQILPSASAFPHFLSLSLTCSIRSDLHTAILRASFEDRFERIRQAPLLILDDFGSQNATSWAQEKLFQIINYRYINRLPMVVTTNLSNRDMDERIQSRLYDDDWVTVVKILAPDHRNPKGDIGYHELSSLELFPAKTFENFSLRNDEGLNKEDLHSLEIAYQAAQDYSEDPRGWLVILGGFSTGKTHLAAAIGNRVAEGSFPPMMIAVPDLLDHLRATFSPNSPITLDRRFEEIRHIDLLILDDLGTQSSTPWVKEKLYQLFNYRYNAELPTVITSSASLEELDPRLRSRMLDRRICEIFAITAPPFIGKPRQNSRKSGGRIKRT